MFCKLSLTKPFSAKTASENTRCIQCTRRPCCGESTILKQSIPETLHLQDPPTKNATIADRRRTKMPFSVSVKVYVFVACESFSPMQIARFARVLAMPPCGANTKNVFKRKAPYGCRHLGARLWNPVSENDEIFIRETRVELWIHPHLKRAMPHMHPGVQLQW